MKVDIEVPEYLPEKGLEMNWEYGFTIEVKMDKNMAIIRADSAGLKSLAIHLLTLAQSGVPSGHHFHYDETNSLEDGSCELVIEKY